MDLGGKPGGIPGLPCRDHLGGLGVDEAFLHYYPLLLRQLRRTGLDPQARRGVWEIVGALKRAGKTVFFTTHYMEEADQLCHRVAIIDEGQIIALSRELSDLAHECASQQGKEAINFQLSITLYGAVATLLTFVLIGFLLLWILLFFWLIVVIVAAVKASDGVSFRYPATIRFLG